MPTKRERFCFLKQILSLISRFVKCMRILVKSHEATWFRPGGHRRLYEASFAKSCMLSEVVVMPALSKR